MSITAWVIIVLSVIGLSYTLISQRNGQPTISMVMRDTAWDFSLLPFAWGYLIGHWFFPRQNLIEFGWAWSLPFLVALLAFDIIWKLRIDKRTWYRYPGFYFLLGLPTESPIP